MWHFITALLSRYCNCAGSGEESSSLCLKGWGVIHINQYFEDVVFQIICRQCTSESVSNDFGDVSINVFTLSRIYCQKVEQEYIRSIITEISSFLFFLSQTFISMDQLIHVRGQSKSTQFLPILFSFGE